MAQPKNWQPGAWEELGKHFEFITSSKYFFKVLALFLFLLKVLATLISVKFYHP